VIRLARSELLKLRTTRLWWGLLIGVLFTSAAFAGLIAGIATTDAGEVENGRAFLGDPATARAVYTAGLNFAYLFTLALGVIVMAGEYRHRTMSSTVLATPRRLRIVVAKLVALLLVGAGYGVAAIAASVLAGATVIAVRGADVRLTSDGVPRALVLAILAVALWTIIGLGVGTLIRNQILALLLAVGIAWIAEPIVGLILNAVGAGAVARFLPTQATAALVEPSTGVSEMTLHLLPWWGGALTLLGYAVVSGALGTGLTLRRDVT